MGQWPRDLTPKVASWSQIIYLLIKNRAQVALEMAFTQETHRSDRMTNELWDLHVSVALLKNIMDGWASKLYCSQAWNGLVSLPPPLFLCCHLYSLFYNSCLLVFFFFMWYCVNMYCILMMLCQKASCKCKSIWLIGFFTNNFSFNGLSELSQKRNGWLITSLEFFCWSKFTMSSK